MQATRQLAVLSIVTSLVTLALKFGAFFLSDSVSLLSDALEAIRRREFATARHVHRGRGPLHL
jgi:hypothetical protein